jgi:hypothetical protein
LVVVIVAGSKLFAEPYVELLFYASLIFVAVIVFSVMAKFYRYNNDQSHADEHVEHCAFEEGDASQEEQAIASRPNSRPSSPTAIPVQ